MMLSVFPQDMTLQHPKKTAKLNLKAKFEVKNSFVSIHKDLSDEVVQNEE